MIYSTTHITHYRYETPVSHCQSQLRLTPRTLPWQSVLSTTIETTPAAAWHAESVDYFQNLVTSVAIHEHHDRFSIVSRGTVRVDPRPPVPVSSVAWEDAREALAWHGTPELLEGFAYTMDSPYVAAHPELTEYARESFLPGRPMTEATGELAHRINKDFKYKPASTSIETPLLDALRARQGVCQDFSHIMIGALRSLGLSARYVSGYLRSGSERIGSEASHAWVAVHMPGFGWAEFDPTNDVLPATEHLTLAWGRDYGDVTPVRGVAIGGGRQKVDVDVRVEPIE